MCTNPKFIERENKYPTNSHVLSRLALVVPCGKCVECLKTRQQAFSTRIYREAIKGDKLFFVTFTYNNEHLPLAKRLVRIDKDTGEVEPVSSFEIMGSTDFELLSELRCEIAALPSTSSARHVKRLVFETPNFLWQMEVTPSLNRLDVRNWLKKVRIQYKREFKVSLPEFKYAVCGEYGPRGGRPHYHALFFGLSHFQLSWILSRWERKFGYCLMKEVPLRNADGSNARLLVSRYVGKYIAKGKFDLDSCKNGECEKGRLFNSKCLGTSLTVEEIRYFRCYDLFGEYDVDNPELTLNKQQIDILADEILKRSRLPLSGTEGKDGMPLKVALPRCLLRKVWYVPQERVVEWSYVTTSIKSDYLKNKFLRNYYACKTPKKVERVLVSPKILSYVSALSRARFISRYIGKHSEIRSERDASEASLETYFELLKYSKVFGDSAREFREENLLQREYFSGEKDNQ